MSNLLSIVEYKKVKQKESDKKDYKKRNNYYKRSKHWYYVFCPLKDGKPKWVSTGQRGKKQVEMIEKTNKTLIENQENH